MQLELTHLNFTLYNMGTLYKDHTRNTIPKRAKIEALKNHTLLGSTYLLIQPLYGITSPRIVGFFYKTLSFNSVLQLLTDVAIFLCLIHIFSTRSLKTKTLWEGRGLLGTWSNLLHFVSLIVFFEGNYNFYLLAVFLLSLMCCIRRI